MKGKQILIVFSMWMLNLVHGEYKITPEIKARCKEYYCTNGYQYKQYFKVGEEHRPGNMTFELHIAIKAPNNGHILLSSTADPKMSDPVYEITIGAGSNTFSELRRMRMKFGKSTVDTKNILNYQEYVPFWIKIFKDGQVKFGREGEDLAILSWKDPMPLDINFFSFAAWNGIEARVLYDCPNGDQTFEESTAVPQAPMEDVQRLRKDLISDYRPYDVPLIDNEKFKNVYFTHEIRNVMYDVKKGQLVTSGKIFLQWLDYKLTWDPAEYGGIESMTFAHHEVWVPELVLYDSLELDDLRWGGYPMVVNNQGSIVRELSFRARTICTPTKSPKGAQSWPRDEHECTLRFGTWSPHRTLKFIALNNMRLLVKIKKPADRDFIASTWDLVANRSESVVTTYSPYAKYFAVNVDDAPENTINIYMTIKRKYKTLSANYFTPLFSCIIALLSTFWITSYPTTKNYILCLNLFVIFICLLQIVMKVPVYEEHIPNIVLFYLWVMIGILISLTVNVILINFRSDPKPAMGDTLKKFLIGSPLTTALGLPDLKMKDSYSGLQENSDDDDHEEQYWDMLEIGVDRSMFIIYSVAAVTILFYHY